MAEDNSTFTQTGGARLGCGFWAFNASFPLAKISVTDDALELTIRGIFGNCYSFPRGSILKLHKYSSVSLDGLRIEHLVSSYEPFIMFWTFNFDELEQALEKHGFHLEQNSGGKRKPWLFKWTSWTPGLLLSSIFPMIGWTIVLASSFLTLSSNTQLIGQALIGFTPLGLIALLAHIFSDDMD
jgi:hypothetical protein